LREGLPVGESPKSGDAEIRHIFIYTSANAYTNETTLYYYYISVNATTPASKKPPALIEEWLSHVESQAPVTSKSRATVVIA